MPLLTHHHHQLLLFIWIKENNHSTMEDGCHVACSDKSHIRLFLVDNQFHVGRLYDSLCQLDGAQALNGSIMLLVLQPESLFPGVTHYHFLVPNHDTFILILFPCDKALIQKVNPYFVC